MKKNIKITTAVFFISVLFINLTINEKNGVQGVTSQVIIGIYNTFK